MNQISTSSIVKLTNLSLELSLQVHDGADLETFFNAQLILVFE